MSRVYRFYTVGVIVNFLRMTILYIPLGDYNSYFDRSFESKYRKKLRENDIVLELDFFPLNEIL